MAMKYTVIAESKSDHNPKMEKVEKSERAAIATAREWAKDHPDLKVFVQFNRSSDGQQGYINRDGAGITGKAW